MEDNHHLVADIPLSNDSPTAVPLRTLYQWIVWQFPRLKDQQFCAAVRPPLPHAPWIPALIHSGEKVVQIFAHLDQKFDTPEAAADFFFKADE